MSHAHPANNDELFALYAQADVAVMPLKANLHASGCTAIQEATLVDMAGDPEALAHQVVAARAKLDAELGVANFVRRHVALSREMLGVAS